MATTYDNLPSQGAERATGKYADLFRGESRGRSLGSELSMMRLVGQEIIRNQRARWQFNRSMYRGDQYIRPSGGSTLRSLAPAHRLPSGHRRDVVNRSRRFIDGRASLITMNRPNFEVAAEAATRAAYQAAQMAEKVLDFYWEKLDLETIFRAMVRQGDVDGVAFVCIYYDMNEGDRISLPFSQDGRPIADPGMLAAMDAEGISTWTEFSRIGDVCVRNVPIGRLAIDPMARDKFSEARWIIESRVRARADVERDAGMTLEEIMASVGQKPQKPYPYVSQSQPQARVGIDEFDETDTTFSGRDFVLVHEAFIKETGETGDWPKGLHAMWLDQAPQRPIYVDPWRGALPYICYVPQPDEGHFLRSKAVMDDLAPLNIRLNRAVSQYNEILDLYARAPVMAQRGSLVSKHIYNSQRIVEYNVGFNQPNWMQMPPEPMRLMENINFILEQMAEISVQQDVARGTPPGQGVDAGVSLHFLGQQNEQQLSGLEAAVKRAIQDICTMLLRNICDYFTVPRMLAIPGVYGVEEFSNFVGSMLRGCTRVRVIGSLLPRNRAAQIQTLIQLGSNGLFDARPYVAQLTEGRVDEIITDMERQQREQRNENRDMDLLGSLPNIDQLWQQFQMLRIEHAKAVTQLEQHQQAAEADMLAQGEDPSQVSMMLPQAPAPPTLADMGVPIPMPDEWNDDAIHLGELDRRRMMDGFKQLHPLVRQAYHEHSQAHQARLSANLTALAPTQMAPDVGQGAAGAATPAAPTPQASPGAGGGAPNPAAPQDLSQQTQNADGSTSFTSPEFGMQPAQISVNFASDSIKVETPPPAEVKVEPHIEVRPSPAPTVHVTPQIRVDAPTIPEPHVTVRNEMQHERPKMPLVKFVPKYDSKGKLVEVVPVPMDEGA